MADKVKILHINDLHSHLNKWPKIRRFIGQKKAQFQREGNSVFTFDIGDAMDRVHPLTEATDGQKNVELMNEIGFDGVTIGNNEGLGNTMDQLNHLYDYANFDVILGNLLTLNDRKQPSWAKDGKIVKTKGGTRILILGLTAPYMDTYPKLGWRTISVEKMLPYLLKKFEGQADYVILLSHLGLNVDQAIAKQFPQVGLIIGAHTHHLLVHGQQIGNSLLAAAGKYGEYVGQVDLVFDDNHKLISNKATVTPVEGLVAAPADKGEVAHYSALGEQILSEQSVAKLPSAMETSWTGYSRVIGEGLLAIQEFTHTNAAILNSGLFLTNLPAGVVNRNDIHKLLPHSIHAMKVTLSGYDLWRLIREMEKNRNYLLRFPIKGIGFRGKVFGAIDYSGISYEEDSKAVLYRNSPISPMETYEVGMVDNYSFIPYFPTIEIVGKNEIFSNFVLRDVFSQYLAEHYPI